MRRLPRQFSAEDARRGGVIGGWLVLRKGA
jgi:hypothetical protein